MRRNEPWAKPNTRITARFLPSNALGSEQYPAYRQHSPKSPYEMLVATSNMRHTSAIVDSRQTDNLGGERSVAEFPSKRDLQTKLARGIETADTTYGALVPPVYRATTYHQPDPWSPSTYDYARSGNPTRNLFESAMAALEHGERGLAFSSGMAALSAFFLMFQSGDHLIVTRDCQGGTQRVLRGVFQRFGLSVSYVDTDDLDSLKSSYRENTVAVLVENFSNPFLRVSDIEAISLWARQKNLLVAVDNTFITPYLQNPLLLGADIVIHSATKMIGGHSDITAGVVIAKDRGLGDRLYFIQNACGAVLSPDDAYLAHRGLSTLPVRMDHASQAAGEIAEWLASRISPERLFYPGLPTHPGHDLCRRQMRGFGQMLTFRLASREAVAQFAHRLKLASIGAGFGGTETIVSLPELHCHAALTSEERVERDIGGDVVRVSVGLESHHDLLSDFEQALDGLI